MTCLPRSPRSLAPPGAARPRVALAIALLGLGVLGPGPVARVARAHVVIRQLYGGGGHLYDRDFVELFNQGGSPVAVDGWSIQYASATGTGLFSGQPPTPLAGTLAPGQSLLIGLAASASGAPLPEPFLAGQPGPNLASGSGKVALVRSTEGLACNGSTTPCGPLQEALLADLVGYGSAQFFEGTAAAPAASTTAALHRLEAGCRDRWANDGDFAPAPPSPRTAADPPTPCPFGLEVELALDAAFASEADRTVLGLLATTDAPVAAPLSVAVALGGPGITESDFSERPLRLDFAAGSTSARALVVLADDVLEEGSERASLRLTDFPPALRPGAAIQRTLIVADDDGCGLAATAIHAVQGSGAVSPLAGQIVAVEGIVVGRFLGSEGDSLQGVFVQAEDVDGDGDPATSEGLFVHEAGSGLAAGLAVGDRVRATGRVAERAGRTVLESLTSVELCTRGEPLPTAAELELPIAGAPDDDLAAAAATIAASYETREGMRVVVPGPLTIAESFDLARLGQLVLDHGGRIARFTENELPGAAGFLAHRIGIARRRIVLDDGDDREDSALANGRPLPHPAPGLSLSHRFRAGDRITSLSGILDPFASAPNALAGGRIRPVPESTSPAFVVANPRPAGPPEVGGALVVASFNAANFFATIDTTASNSSGPCGPSRTLDCRGADSEAERSRQLAKLVAALCRLDPDVAAWMELENGTGDAAASALVAAANAVPGCGPFGFLATGPIGEDAIRVALVHQPASVTPVGAPAILDGRGDPRFDDRRNRPVLAQTLHAPASGHRFTLAIAHLKSKGSSCAFLGDPDTGDGQGHCNATRRAAAAALVDWLASDPTASGDPDFLIVGDLNSYRREDPVRTILAGADDVAGTADDWIDLVHRYAGAEAHSYVFDGQTGRLDHALASPALAAQVTGAAVWGINADEPPAFDYDDGVSDPGEAPFEAKPRALPLFAPDELRLSDHDPLVFGLPEPKLAPALAGALGGLASGFRRRRAGRLRGVPGNPGRSIRRHEPCRRDERQLVRGDEPRRRRDHRTDRVDRGVRRRHAEIREVRRILDRITGAHAGDAVHLDHITLFGRPVRRHRISQAPAEPELDHRAALRDPRPDALEATDRALADLHVAEVEVLRGRAELDVEAHLVEGDLEGRRHHLGGVEEDEHALPGPFVEARRVRRRGEADVEPGLGGGVGRGVDGLEHRDAVDPAADGRRDQPEHVREAGVDAGAVEGDAAAAGGLVEAAHVPLAVGPARDEVGGRDDVDPRLEQPDHVVDDPLEGHVEHAVRAQGEDRLDVVRRRDADALAETAQVAHVLTDLVGAPGMAADERELGVGEDRLDGAAPDEAGGPLHDAQGHGRSFRDGFPGPGRTLA